MLYSPARSTNVEDPGVACPRNPSGVPYTLASVIGTRVEKTDCWMSRRARSIRPFGIQKYVCEYSANVVVYAPAPKPSLGRSPSRSYFPVGNVCCTRTDVVGTGLPT